MYNVGTRGKRVDQPVWPTNLSVEVFTAHRCEELMR
jgi:hypothetical protein